MVAHPRPLIEVLEHCISLWLAGIAGSLTAHVLCSVSERTHRRESICQLLCGGLQQISPCCPTTASATRLSMENYTCRGNPIGTINIRVA